VLGLAGEYRPVTEIEAYIAELAGALRGPGRAKADLVAEARDSLVDAATAYHAGGMDRTVAERCAVEEFGEVREIAPGYQAELGLAQGRRTALQLGGVLCVQPVAWWLASRSPGWATGQPSPGYALVDDVVTWLGVAAVAGALLAALACGVGVRYLAARHRLTRDVGVFSLLVCGVFAIAGLVQTGYGPHGLPAGLPWLAVLAMIPLTSVALSARRCIAAGQQVGG
jgi:hypothetical protein